MPARYRTGLETLAATLRRRRGRRTGLLTHPAAVTAGGVHAADLLRAALGRDLVALFGPEHGYWGHAGAGDAVAGARHPEWDIPVHSLYGEHRRPTREMLEGLDLLVVDLQDLAVRCYTFCSTLRLVMEACAGAGVEVIVADRPVPWPDAVDGPRPAAGFESFVAGVPVPFVYGLTPGELARFLARELKLDLELSVARLHGWRRDPAWPAGATWISPSPAIRTWETAWCYPLTVLFEAFPAFDVNRGGILPFHVFGAADIPAAGLLRALRAARLPGLAFEPHHWMAGGKLARGVRVLPRDPARIRPAAAAVAIVHALQSAVGRDALWSSPGARPDWFDKLMGTDAVRRALQAGAPWREIVRAWRGECAAFRAARREVLLYP